MEKTMTINVGFSLSDPLHTKIIQTSIEIRDKYHSDWWVDDIKYHLHFPVYLFELPQKKEGLLIKAADRYFRLCKRIKVEAEDLHASKSGLIMITFNLTDDIFKLHNSALEIFNPLREQCLRKKYRDPAYLAKISEEKRAYVSRYGSEYVLEHYEPHTTIARIEDENLRSQILKSYESQFIGSTGYLDRIQIHKAIFSEDKASDRTVLLYDRKMNP